MKCSDYPGATHANTSKQQYNIDLCLIYRIVLDKRRLRFYD
jgi:hypothetical protein